MVSSGDERGRRSTAADDFSTHNTPMVQQHRARRATTVSLVALVAILTTALPSAAGELEDPTADLIPSMECDSATCLEATDAVDDREYARAGELFATHVEEATLDEDIRGAWLVFGAYAYEQSEAFSDAASLYERAADRLEQIDDYLMTRATRATLKAEQTDEAIVDRALETGALRTGYEDGHLLEARIRTRRTGAVAAEAVERALESTDDPESVCTWLVDALSDRPDADERAVDLAWGHCVDDDHTRVLEDFDHDPSIRARLQRADRLAADVEFEAALEVLDTLEDGQLTDRQWCRRQFRRARSHFRLRRHRTATDMYLDIVDRCDDEASEDERVRSLYGAGNRKFQRGDLDAAQHLFETLYEEYPERSHADDALMFLARIERNRDDHDREREIELLVEALENYPEEDMIHEMAWEVFEPTFRDGNYREFIEAVTRLPLPDWDEEYFSQGRLEYFVGLAHRRLGEDDEAARYFQRAWVKYPFSFYGYLANLRLREDDREPEGLPPEQLGRVGWFEGDFDETGAAVLARAGHLEGACNLERARLAEVDADRERRWRLATLCHQAGNAPVSHDVARRDISGRPWSLPAEGRLARWHVAWPDPYGETLESAIDEYGPDDPLHPGLASSIMREESAFIEDIVSWAGAVGLMQLMPATARSHDDVIDGEATEERLEQADYNIPIAIDHMTELSDSLEAHPVLMVAAYNAGAGRIRSWLRRQPNDEIALWVEDIPILQTRDYTKRVIGSYAAYQYLAGDDELDERVGHPAR